MNAFVSVSVFVCVAIRVKASCVLVLSYVLNADEKCCDYEIPFIKIPYLTHF